jgi:hypothetical protein
MAYARLVLLSAVAVSAISFVAFSQNAGPNWKLEDNQRHVTVTFPTTPPVALQLDVAGIEDILKNLGDFRSVMWPEVTKIYRLGQMVKAIPNPIWATEPDAIEGNTLLHIRDPRYGWLHYMLPREEARKLAAYIQNQVESPRPVPTPDNAK